MTRCHVVVCAATLEDILAIEDDNESGDAGQVMVSSIGGQLVSAPPTINLEALSRWSGLPVASLLSLSPDDLTAMSKKFALAGKDTSAEELATACNEACRRLLLRDTNPATMVCASVAMLADKLVDLRGHDHNGYDSCAIACDVVCLFVQSPVMLFVRAIACAMCWFSGHSRIASCLPS
jgi:hypothetical protein